MMAKTLWLVRQLPLEKYGRWKRDARGLSAAEKVESVMFTRLWRFLQLGIVRSIDADAGPLWEAYEAVLDELDRRGGMLWWEGKEGESAEEEEE